MSALTPDGRYVIVAGRGAARERAQATRARREQAASEPPRCATRYCWHRAAEHDDESGSCRYVTRHVVEPYDRECKCETYKPRTAD